MSWPARLRRPLTDDVPDTINREITRGHHPTPGDGLFAMTTRKSAAITEGASRAPARAMLKAVGFTDADLSRPIIGVANTWIEIGPCNYHLRDLAEEVKAGIRAAGGTPMEFNTVSISDGITMGSEGMKASLVSREVVADSIELVARAPVDGIVILVAANKTSRRRDALVRLDIPGWCSTAARSRPDGGRGATSRFRTCSRRSARMRPGR